MTTINIRKNIKKELSDYTDGSFDKIINQLLDDIEDNMPVVDVSDSPVTTMRIKDDTLHRLDDFKITPYESYESIIVRLLLESDKFK